MNLHFHPIESIKEHPVLFGSVVVGGLALWLLFRHSSSTSGTATASGTDPNVVAADTAIYQQQQQIQGQLALQAAQSGAQYAVAQLNAQTSTTQQVNAIKGQIDLATLQDSTQVQINQDNIAAANYQTTINDQTQLQTQALAFNSAIQLQQIETQANVNIAQINATMQSTIAQYEAQTLQTEAQTQASAIETVAGIQSSGNILTGLSGVGSMIAAFL